MQHRILLTALFFSTLHSAGPRRIASEEWHTPVPPPPPVLEIPSTEHSADNPRFERFITETLATLSRLSSQVSSTTSLVLTENSSATATHDSIEAQVETIGGVDLLLTIAQELKQPDARGHAEIFYNFYRGWFGLDWPAPQHLASYNEYLKTPGLAISPTLKNSILAFNALIYNYLNTHIDFEPTSETYGQIKLQKPATGTIVGITVACTLVALVAGLGGYWWARKGAPTARATETLWRALQNYSDNDKMKRAKAFHQGKLTKHAFKKWLTSATDHQSSDTAKKPNGLLIQRRSQLERPRSLSSVSEEEDFSVGGNTPEEEAGSEDDEEETALSGGLQQSSAADSLDDSTQDFAAPPASTPLLSSTPVPPALPAVTDRRTPTFQALKEGVRRWRVRRAQKESPSRPTPPPRTSSLTPSPPPVPARRATTPQESPQAEMGINLLREAFRRGLT